MVTQTLPASYVHSYSHWETLEEHTIIMLLKWQLLIYHWSGSKNVRHTPVSVEQTISDQSPELVPRVVCSCLRVFFFTCDPGLTNSFGVVPGPQQQLRGPVPERHHNGVKVRQRLEGRVEESGETHVSYRRCAEKRDDVSKQRHYQRAIRMECRLAPGPRLLSGPQAPNVSDSSSGTLICQWPGT